MARGIKKLRKNNEKKKKMTIPMKNVRHRTQKTNEKKREGEKRRQLTNPQKIIPNAAWA